MPHSLVHSTPSGRLDAPEASLTRRCIADTTQVTKRAVCTPDFEQLYRRADEINGGGGGDEFEGGGDVGGPVKMEVA